MKPSLQIKLGQQLTLTPQLRLAIRLLQLSALELEQELSQALESNPLLEREEDAGEESFEPGSAEPKPEAEAAPDSDAPAEESCSLLESRLDGPAILVGIERAVKELRDAEVAADLYGADAHTAQPRVFDLGLEQMVDRARELRRDAQMSRILAEHVTAPVLPRCARNTRSDRRS